MFYVSVFCLVVCCGLPEITVFDIVPNQMAPSISYGPWLTSWPTHPFSVIIFINIRWIAELQILIKLQKKITFSFNHKCNITKHSLASC